MYVGAQKHSLQLLRQLWKWHWMAKVDHNRTYQINFEMGPIVDAFLNKNWGLWKLPWEILSEMSDTDDLVWKTLHYVNILNPAKEGVLWEAIAETQRGRIFWRPLTERLSQNNSALTWEEKVVWFVFPFCVHPHQMSFTPLNTFGWGSSLGWVGGSWGKESNERHSFTLGAQQASGLSHLTLFVILSVNFWICGVLDVPQGAGTNEGHSSTSPRPRKVFCRGFRVMSTQLRRWTGEKTQSE